MSGEVFHGADIKNSIDSASQITILIRECMGATGDNGADNAGEAASDLFCCSCCDLPFGSGRHLIYSNNFRKILAEQERDMRSVLNLLQNKDEGKDGKVNPVYIYVLGDKSTLPKSAKSFVINIADKYTEILTYWTHLTFPLKDVNGNNKSFESKLPSELQECLKAEFKAHGIETKDGICTRCFRDVLLCGWLCHCCWCCEKHKYGTFAKYKEKANQEFLGRTNRRGIFHLDIKDDDSKTGTFGLKAITDCGTEMFTYLRGSNLANLATALQACDVNITAERLCNAWGLNGKEEKTEYVDLDRKTLTNHDNCKTILGGLIRKLNEQDAKEDNIGKLIKVLRLGGRNIYEDKTIHEFLEEGGSIWKDDQHKIAVNMWKLWSEKFCETSDVQLDLTNKVRSRRRCCNGSVLCCVVLLVVIGLLVLAAIATLRYTSLI